MIIDLFGNRLAKKNPQLDFPEKQIQQEKKARSSFSLYPIIEWCKWNGAYVYAYGCSIAGIICGLLSPLLNMYFRGWSVMLGIKEGTYIPRSPRSSETVYLS